MTWSFLLMIAFLACAAMTAVHDCHMWQLASYKSSEYLRWLRRTWRTDWLRRHAFVFAGAFVLSSLFFLAQAYRNRPKAAKKPLVFTPRIKRLLAADAVLHIVILWIAWPSPFLLAAALLASPLLLLLTDRANAPLEKFIAGGYVGDARRILASNPRLTVIGITGSFGKTSVKHFLHRLLSAKYNVFMTPGNYNTTLGVVRAVREGLRPTHDIFLCEMGARHAGDIKEICDLVKPKHGVVTAVGEQHLETFGTPGNILRTKFELVDSLPRDGIAFLNHDSEAVRNHPAAGLAATYCIEPGSADYVARDVSVSTEGSSFSVTLSNGRDVCFATRLIGRHNVLNVTAAIAVADRLGVPENDMAAGVRRLEPVPHRLELREQGGVTIIDDAYNSNPAGAKAALEVLRMFDGFRILVTPGMVELGAMEESLNREFGREAAQHCDCAILVGEKRTRPVRDGLLAGGMAEENIHAVDTIEQAFQKVHAAPSGGRKKIVLLENDLPDNY